MGREFGDDYVEIIAGWHPEAQRVRRSSTSIVGEWRMFMGGQPPEDDV